MCRGRGKEPTTGGDKVEGDGDVVVTDKEGGVRSGQREDETQGSTIAKDTPGFFSQTNRSVWSVVFSLSLFKSLFMTAVCSSDLHKIQNR